MADEILAEQKVFVIPDILANAGGVTVSYFEWVQDRQGFFWNEELVNDRLEEIMVESFDDVVAYAEKHTRPTTASPPTCWRSTAWPSPSSSAASTPSPRMPPPLSPTPVRGAASDCHSLLVVSAPWWGSRRLRSACSPRLALGLRLHAHRAPQVNPPPR